jgi:hypothetical protein
MSIFNSIKNDPDPVTELDAATSKRDELTSSLSNLQGHVDRTVMQRDAARENWERHEEDIHIGRVTEEARKKARARYDAAVMECGKASAMLRDAKDTIARLEKVIAELTPAVHAARITHYVERQKELAAQLAEGLQALVSINDALHANYRAAEDEFPFYYEGRKQGKARLYPVAAGLQNLSWPELRHNPDAIDGGRLGCFLRAVDEFIHPKPPAPPKRRRESPAPPATPAPAVESISAATMSGLDEISKALLQQEQGAK